MYIAEAFQRKAINSIATRFATYKRVLLQSATGSGKTVMAVIFIQEWMEANPGKNVLGLFNLQCLLPQFEASFKYHGMRKDVALFHDLITRAKDGSRMVDHQNDPSRRIMLTMPETFANALKGKGSKDLQLDSKWVDNVGLILIDEAHKGTSDNFQFIRDHIDAPVLGLTATPMRVKNKEGECLANDWEYSLITTVSIRELIEMQRLVQPIYYDLDEDGHLFEEWKKAVAIHSVLDGNYQTIWFCRDTAHAKEWEAKLLEIGQTCAVITSVDDADLGSTSQTPNQREVIYKQFEAREITHLISIQALCEGFDAPIAKYCVIDRGVGNKALYQQILGRVLRPYGEGSNKKLNGHIIDRCGNHLKHGDIEDYVWDLEAEAAEAVVVKLMEKRTLNEGDMERATKIMVKCETHGCPSVYNAKTNMHCPHCEKSHGLEVEVTVANWFASKLPQVQQAIIGNFVTTIGKAMNGDYQAAIALMNKYPELFDDEADGMEFKQDYKALSTICAIKPKTPKDFKKTFRYAA